VSGGHGDPQTRCAPRNSRWADRLGVPAAFNELGAQGEGGLVATKEYAEDRCVVVGQTEAPGEVFHVGPQASAAKVSFGAVDEIDRPVNLSRDDGRDAGAEHEASRGAADPPADGGRAGDEGSGAAEGLAQGADEHVRGDAVQSGMPGGMTVVAEEAEAVRLVEVQAAVSGEVPAHGGRIGVVAVHREQRLGDPPAQRAGGQGRRSRGMGEHADLGALSSGLVMYPEGHARNQSGNLDQLLAHKFKLLAGLGVQDVDALYKRFTGLSQKSASEIADLYDFELLERGGF